MKTQLTIQEKRKDLRVECGLTLEQLAAQKEASADVAIQKHCLLRR